MTPEDLETLARKALEQVNCPHRYGVCEACAAEQIEALAKAVLALLEQTDNTRLREEIAQWADEQNKNLVAPSWTKVIERYRQK